MGSSGLADLIGALLAALSGVVVALFTQYLSQAREAAKERRLLANTRALLALEVRSNRDALVAFWKTVVALGSRPIPGEAATDNSEAAGTPTPPTDPVELLAAMYANGLVSYSLPAWSVVRWNEVEPRTVAALTASQVVTLDGIYRALNDVTDLYARVVTITNEEWADLRQGSSGRFWYRYLAREREPLFTRLIAAVTRVLDTPDPLPGAIPTDK